MSAVLNPINSFYANALHPGFDSFITALSNNHYTIYALIAIIIVLWIVKENINAAKLPGIISFVIGIISILLFIIVYNTFSPELSKLFRSNSSSNLRNSDGAVKQIYYSASCSSCYGQSCPLDGYKYDGSDLGEYTNIVSQCKSCACTSSKAQTLWK